MTSEEATKVMEALAALCSSPMRRCSLPSEAAKELQKAIDILVDLLGVEDGNRRWEGLYRMEYGG